MSETKTEACIYTPGFLFSGIHCGIKSSGAKDLALIYSETPAVAAGMFTTNKVKAAPVILDMQRIRKGRSQAIIVNSGNANACTGEAGFENAKEMANLVASRLSIDPSLVLVCSTGVIGKPLPMENIRKGIPELVSSLKADSFHEAARAVITTDRFPKMRCLSITMDGKELSVCAFAKGAGMIEPRMGTMLAFVMTDANIAHEALKGIVKESVEDTFNRITVDGDRSTNDTVIVLANGVAGGKMISVRDKKAAPFKKALCEVMAGLAEDIVRDGEGATKLVRLHVRGAKSENDARKAAYAIANSLLVKTAFAGGDPNWGRIMAAVGSSGVGLDPGRISIAIGSSVIVQKGVGTGIEAERDAARVMSSPEFDLTVDLGAGKSSFKILTSDITREYVELNAHYRT